LDADRRNGSRKTNLPYKHDASGLQKMKCTYDGIWRFSDVTSVVLLIKNFFQFFVFLA
jgi:hypothetical protein